MVRAGEGVGLSPESLLLFLVLRDDRILREGIRFITDVGSIQPFRESLMTAGAFRTPCRAGRGCASFMAIAP